MTGDTDQYAQDIVSHFDVILPEQERTLERAAQNVQLGLERDSEIYRAFTQLQFFVLTVDFDMRVLLRALLSNPQNRLTAEKFLALMLEESDESTGKMISTVNKALRKSAHDSGAHLVDVEKFNEAVSNFKQNMASMKADKKFNETLRLIRNTVAGHIVGNKTGIQNSAIWVLTRAHVPRDSNGVLKSQIVSYSIETMKALHTFAGELQDSYSTQSRI
ncbi:hypothetical protein ACFSYH_10475 [Populibacterium corticicola]|uniref:RiboL-PSP-HEPN domain-containing protein n=1 Tax=Populibacterium corticicola TaxID=1812826 RepID=A0ABW5XGL1_9MICO